MNYSSESEFLKNYDASKYDRLSVTSDILLFSVSDGHSENYRKLKKKYFSVLLVKRKNYPFKDKWCLPGGFIRSDETTEDAARRILANETNLHDVFMEQLYTFDDIDRDPRCRTLGVTYMSLVDKNKLNCDLFSNASWFNIICLEDDSSYHVTLDNGSEELKFVVSKTLKESTTDRYKFDIVSSDIAFDHPKAIISGIERLKNKIMYTDIVFNMMGEYFTLGELQQVYEVILGKKLLDAAFRRIIASKVEATNKMKTGEGHRPSKLFKYRGRKNEKNK
ncbi:MAG: NrtR DNA-binding winged helix domain-containing protein [Bacilli bacterium]